MTRPFRMSAWSWILMAVVAVIWIVMAGAVVYLTGARRRRSA